MTLIGKRSTKKDNGEISTTAYVTDNFPAYYSQHENGRFCEGLCCEAIFVGAFDLSKIPIGSTIEILYDKAIALKTGGFYQPIKDIRLISNAK